MQVSTAAALVMVAEVLFTPEPMVNCRFCGAETVIFAVPGNLHVAIPRLLIEATGMFDEDHERPSARTNNRLLLSLKFPVAVNPTVPCELLAAVAVEGVTVMLLMVGWPAPHPMIRVATSTKEGRTIDDFFMIT